MKELIIETKIHVYTQSELDTDKKEWFAKAKEAAEKAYAPYSQFKVGAAAVLSNGLIITGSNQENAAYPSAMCAERTCLYYAHAQYPDASIEALIIVAKQNGQFTSHHTPPCGSCRQVIKEYEELQEHPIPIYMVGEDEVYVVASIVDLLPLSFRLNR